MSDLLPLLIKLEVDLVLSANDRFQQVIDVEGEPLHVATSGGGEKLSKRSTLISEERYIASINGFARVSVDAKQLEIVMLVV